MSVPPSFVINPLNPSNNDNAVQRSSFPSFPPQYDQETKRIKRNRIIAAILVVTVITIVIMITAVILSSPSDVAPPDDTHEDDKPVIDPIDDDDKPASISPLSVHFLDVGQADATLIKGNNLSILIDAGHWQRSDVVPKLLHLNVTYLDLLILTHPHADHIGQVPSVVYNIPTKEAFASGDLATTQTFGRYLRSLLINNVLYKEPRQGDFFVIKDLEIEVLNPRFIDGNFHRGCLSTRITYGNISFIFTGDAESITESTIVNRNVNISAQILKLGHHGSSTSTTQKFLDAVKPMVGIWSASSTNQYGHPHLSVLERLDENQVNVYGTAVNGDIEVVVDGKGGFEVIPSKGEKRERT
ncbi:hypothetical protein GEMRC1_008877 [Eukaryota sp. GEM-RC1]